MQKGKDQNNWLFDYGFNQSSDKEFEAGGRLNDYPKFSNWALLIPDTTHKCPKLPFYYQEVPNQQHIPGQPVEYEYVERIVILPRLCEGCAMPQKGIIGLFSRMSEDHINSCPVAYIHYQSRRFKLNDLESIFTCRSLWVSYLSLVSFLSLPHFDALYQDEIKHPLDKILYQHARDFEIKQMRRIRALLELEKDFYYKY